MEFDENTLADTCIKKNEEYTLKNLRHRLLGIFVSRLIWSRKCFTKKFLFWPFWRTLNSLLVTPTAVFDQNFEFHRFFLGKTLFSIDNVYEAFHFLCHSFHYLIQNITLEFFYSEPHSVRSVNFVLNFYQNLRINL